MRNLSDISLAIVCPMANEAETATRFVDSVLMNCAAVGSRKFLGIVDEASKDDTRKILEAHATNVPELKVVWAPENRGVVDAYVRGYREALQTNADWILEIDAGFSHQPSDIPPLLEKMRQGYDCVFGSRFCPGGSFADHSSSRYWISFGGTRVTNLLLGTRLKDMTSGFQLFTRQALETILRRGIQSRGPFFQTEMKAHCRDLNVVEVPIQYRTPTHVVGSAALGDAFVNLWRLFRARLAGSL
ncbi:MAG TPA: glycosyltransferase [Chthoniobacterales bacterium]|nr:glycosyltransferase [Chthoniobacterales bacterium]